MAKIVLPGNSTAEIPPASRVAIVRRNILAGVTVAMIAVPLSVGIAAISPGIPPWAGILSGIIGGILVGSKDPGRPSKSLIFHGKILHSP